MSSFELVHGRTRTGEGTSFGEMVLLLHSSLYPPQFAGNFQQVLEIDETDDEIWENEVGEYMDSENSLV